MLSTRRGKQFNSMVFREHDPLTGADRDALFICGRGRRAPGRGREGDAVAGALARPGEVPARVHVARMRPGNVQMFFPECNLLIAAGRRDRERRARLQRRRRGGAGRLTARYTPSASRAAA